MSMLGRLRQLYRLQVINIRYASEETISYLGGLFHFLTLYPGLLCMHRRQSG